MGNCHLNTKRYENNNCRSHFAENWKLLLKTVEFNFHRRIMIKSHERPLAGKPSSFMLPVLSWGTVVRQKVRMQHGSNFFKRQLDVPDAACGSPSVSLRRE